jgi:hypothetical protein
MEVFKHKIRLKKFISSIDSNNDGVLDSIVLTNKDVYVPVILKQTIQDLGLYTDESDAEQIIDLTSFWDTTNTGVNDAEEILDIGEIIDDYAPDDDVIQLSQTGTVVIVGCMDSNALNYSSSATSPCSDCCEYPQGGDSFGGGFSDSGGSDVISNHMISFGVCDKSTFNDAKNALRDEARRWCKATASRCNGNPYPTSVGCAGNGCLTKSSVCCPGPKDTYQLLEKCPKDYNCNGDICTPDKIFTDIKLKDGPFKQSTTCGCKKRDKDNNCTEYYYIYNYTIEFYCIKK